MNEKGPPLNRRGFLGLWKSPLSMNVLRPPGAVPEDVFASKCIRCGRCVEVCPYRSIFPLDALSGIWAGTPLIDVISVPCYLCMKCVEVCPTGTLMPVDQADVRMGLAVVDRYLCVTWSGQALCRSCYNVCPFKDKAIHLDELRPVVDSRYCTGCGLCVHACPMTDQGLGASRGARKAVNCRPLTFSGRDW